MLKTILTALFITLVAVIGLEVFFLFYHPATPLVSNNEESITVPTPSKKGPKVVGINPDKLSYLNKNYKDRNVTFARVVITDKTKIQEVIKGSDMALVSFFYKKGIKLEGYSSTWYFPASTKVTVTKLVKDHEESMDFDELKAGDSILFTTTFDLAKNATKLPVEVKITKI